MVGALKLSCQRAPSWNPPKGAVIVRNRSGEGQWTQKYFDGGWKYRYPAAVVEANAAEKYRKNLIFARALPKIRSQYIADLKRGDRRAVIALVVALIDQAFFRVGTVDTDDIDVYGATTLRKRHLKFQGNEARFDFFGKHHQEQHKVIVDRTLLAMLKKLHGACRSGHDRLFRFEGAPITARDVNQYLAEYGATAKMFRTYHATRLARSKLLAHQGAAHKYDGVAARGAEIKERSQIVTEVVKEVAKMIGHEPATCRGSYIDPRVIDAFMHGRLK